MLQILLGLTFLFFSLAPAFGQAVNEPERVRLLIAGGLLGKVDGFCEPMESTGDSRKADAAPGDAGEVCASGTRPLGGLQGVREKIQSIRASDSYVLLAGNNFPKDFDAKTAQGAPFWESFASLGANVVALGQDDFLRAVFPAMVKDGHFSTEVIGFLREGAAKYRFLASNAAVRTNRRGINKVWDKGYELMISPDESVGWATAKMKFALPSAADKAVYVTVTENAKASDKPKCVDMKKGAGSIPVELRPGSKYTVDVIDGNSTAQFQFTVDEAVTPWENQPEILKGAPVAWLAREGRTPLLVAAMADPTVTSSLDPSQWKDKEGDGAASLVFYPPVEAAKAILSRADKSGALPVLLSDFGDALSAQVVSSSSAWRVVSFNGDSHILGCENGEKGCAKGRGSDYESGGYAIVDQQGERARVWARPEWVGETLIEVSATVRSGGLWDNVSATNKLVEGYRRMQDELVQSQTKRIQFTGVPRFQQAFAGLMPGSTKRIWWQTRADMAAVIMDAMRTSLKTDLAMADQRNIDPEVIDELRRKADAHLISTIGIDELLEILWRHDAYTVVKITGKDLATALGKLAKLQADDDGGSICVRGLGGPQFQEGCSIPEKLKTDQIEVNGRYFNSDQFYSVALPQSAARAADLTYSRKKAVNVFDVVLAYVKKLTPEELERISPEKEDKGACKVQPDSGRSRTKQDEKGLERAVVAWAQPFVAQAAARAASPAPGGHADPGNTLEPRALNWPNLLSKKWLGMIFLPPAAIELGGQNFTVPDRQGKPDASGFAAIPQVGEKAQHTFKFNLVGELHVVPLDLAPVSLDLFSKVNLNRLDTYPNTPTGFTQFSYTPDQWTNGVAIRSKVVTDALTKISATVGRFVPADKRQTVRLQPFIGYFDDTSVFHYTATYTRSADNAVLEESDAKSNYAYLGVGLEVSPILLGKYLTLKGTKFEQDWGVNYAAPKGVHIGGTSFTMEDVRRCGVQNLIDGKQGCATAQDGLREVRYLYATQRQSRQQIASSLEFGHGPDNRKRTLTLDIKATRWGTAPGGFTALDPIRTAEFVIKSSFPLGAGISFGPYYRYLTVNAFGSNGNFISKRYGFTLTVPLTAKAGQSRFFF